MGLRLGFIMFGIFLITFAQANTLTCSRVDQRQGSCKLARSGFLWSEEKEMPVNKLRDVKLYGPRDNESPKVVIDTSAGEIPFSSFTSYVDEDQQKKIVSQIRNFIKNTEERDLQVEQRDMWWILIGGISLVVGVYPLLKPKS